jgi:hypothetical protein
MGTNKVKKCKVRKIIFGTGLTRAAKAGKNLLYRHEEPNEPTKERPLSFVLFKSPFTSVSSVSRGPTPLNISVDKNITYILLALGSQLGRRELRRLLLSWLLRLLANVLAASSSSSEGYRLHRRQIKNKAPTTCTTTFNTFGKDGNSKK